MLIALLTGISFSIWFVDAFDYWNNLIHFNLPKVGWVALDPVLFWHLYSGRVHARTGLLLAVSLCAYPGRDERFADHLACL